jgi:hypothetical protein
MSRYGVTGPHELTDELAARATELLRREIASLHDVTEFTTGGAWFVDVIAARIALEAGVPLVPAGIAGTADLSHLAKLKVVFGEPIAVDDLAEMSVDDAAHLATDRLSAKITELEESLR